jgi:hypothetical protein
MRKCYATSKVHENQCVGLIRECCETHSPEDGNKSSFWNVVFSSFLEYQTMDKGQKPSNYESTVSGISNIHYGLKTVLSLSGWYITTCFIYSFFILWLICVCTLFYAFVFTSTLSCSWYVYLFYAFFCLVALFYAFLSSYSVLCIYCHVTLCFMHLFSCH